MSEQRDNSGALFRNDRRENDKQPEFTGSVMIDGVDYWISAWVKGGKRGKFFSLAFKPKQDRQPGQRISDRARATGPREDLDDSIPF